MVSISQNVSLKQYNTFGVDVKAKWYAEVYSEDDIVKLFTDDRWQSEKLLILGGGSNILFTQNFDGLVIRIAIQGIAHQKQGEEVFVTSGAGVVWNDFVQYCVNNNFGGVENLSLIPGSVGASPVQNIGAYGVEVQDIFYSCRAFNIETGSFSTFYKDDCSFGYRESIFKGRLKGKTIITQVCFKLSKVCALNTTYGAISHELTRRGIAQPTIKDISTIVSQIRVDKLPDPSTIGSAGSFFKNPVISQEEFKKLQSVFPEIVHFCLANSTVKLAAGWLIEQCGWKGKVIGNTGTWKNQALVLVNHGNATGSEVYDLSERIIEDVKTKFNIQLEREVNVI